MNKQEILHCKFIAAKALGIINAISNLEKSERAATPSVDFSEDYNGLVLEVFNNCPGIEELLPPKAQFGIKEGSHERYSRARYGEIYAYCEQIYQMVTTLYQEAEKEL